MKLLVAALALLVSVEIPTPESLDDDPPRIECHVPFEGLDKALPPGYRNLRRVSANMLDVVNDFYAAFPTNPPQKWTFAALVETQNGGLVYLGHDDKICGAITVPTYHWRTIIRLLEGISA